MLTRDDIVFEEDLFANKHIHSQDEVKKALIELINAFVIELGIKRLDKVVVKKTDFFDTKLGIANYKNYTIVLANNIAFCLADKNARFYQRSLMVLKHELYHFQDFQNLLLNRVLKHISVIDDEAFDSFHYWSEFFASYSTFNVYEDENLYSSFKSVYEKSYSSKEEKKYYASQLMGYYLHKNHSSTCDKLVQDYLSGEHIEQAKEFFNSILRTYPSFSTEQLNNIGMILNELVVKKVEPPIYTPVSRTDILRDIIRKSRGNQ